MPLTPPGTSPTIKRVWPLKQGQKETTVILLRPETTSKASAATTASMQVTQQDGHRSVMIVAADAYVPPTPKEEPRPADATPSDVMRSSDPARRAGRQTVQQLSVTWSEVMNKCDPPTTTIQNPRNQDAATNESMTLRKPEAHWTRVQHRRPRGPRTREANARRLECEAAQIRERFGLHYSSYSEMKATRDGRGPHRRGPDSDGRTSYTNRR